MLKSKTKHNLKKRNYFYNIPKTATHSNQSSSIYKTALQQLKEQGFDVTLALDQSNTRRDLDKSRRGSSLLGGLCGGNTLYFPGRSML